MERDYSDRSHEKILFRGGCIILALILLVRITEQGHTWYMAEYGFVGKIKLSFPLCIYAVSWLKWNTLFIPFRSTWNGLGRFCQQKVSPLPLKALSSTLSDHLSDWCWWSITNTVLTFLKIETDIRDISRHTTYFFWMWPCSAIISHDRVCCT